MKHLGIISEFNPFHKGHAYLLEEAKRLFPEKGIVCLMSGNFVQRGAFAVQEKYSRARTALLSGADLVLELPFPFSMLSAEGFGGSAVSVLARTGVVDTLVFGSEVSDAKRLFSVAENLSSPAFQAALEAYLSLHKGKGYPAARERVYEDLFGKEEILSLSNASLALEYLSAAKKLFPEMVAVPVLRKGEGVRSLESKEGFISATLLRKMIFEGEDVSAFVPSGSSEEMKKEKNAGRFPVDTNRLFDVLRYLLKTSSRKELSSYYGFSALCDRAVRHVHASESFDGLVEKMKNASFTDSRIRRGLVSALCRVPRLAEKETPAYTLVLGANEKGREILTQMKEASSIPVFTKPSHPLRSKDRIVLRQASCGAQADEIYAMAFPEKQEEGYFLKQTPTII